MGRVAGTLLPTPASVQRHCEQAPMGTPHARARPCFEGPVGLVWPHHRTCEDFSLRPWRLRVTKTAPRGRLLTTSTSDLHLWDHGPGQGSGWDSEDPTSLEQPQGVTAQYSLSRFQAGLIAT